MSAVMDAWAEVGPPGYSLGHFWTELHENCTGHTVNTGYVLLNKATPLAIKRRLVES